jgi:hypothetical protein
VISLKKSTTCNRAEGLANNLFHTKCEKPGVAGQGGLNKKSCHIFERGKFIEHNQPLAIARGALPTILSTEVVYNWMVVLPWGWGIVQRGLPWAPLHALDRQARPACARVPCFCAEEIFPYESICLAHTEPIAHSFIHKSCAELVLLPRGQHVTLPH